MAENREGRQREMEEERKLGERSITRGRGQTVKPHPSSRDQYTEFKEELEKTRLRPIPRNTHSRMEPRQTDFTHLLRPVRNGTTSTTPTSSAHRNKQTFF